ncbi:MAG: iron-siderophore ABC transporter substrate-binding protein [Acidimicrobiales bacterium]|nr:iron-siderophore ABC transporter substrate-binding protein [Acidimicrobiales bacterium]
MRSHPWSTSLGLLLSVTLVAACGGGGDGGDDTGTAAGESGAATATDGEFPLTVEHRFGTTEIPEEPERVVTAGFNDADYALAFGVVPVGVRDFIGTFDEDARPWAQEALAGATPVKVSDSDGVLDYEEIAGARPDLILAYSYLEEDEYETLSQIAPTVVEPEIGSMWEAHTRDVGRALGQSERAEEIVAEVGQHVETTRAAHPEFEGVTLAIQFGVEPEAYYLLEPGDPRIGLFTSLGFVMPETTGEISREQVELLDQELLVVIGDEAAYEADELLQGLDAVQEGRVVYLGGFETDFAGALGFDSPLSLPYAVDQVAPLLAEALAAGTE